MLDTTNWATYPFEVQGIQFVSKLDKDGSMYSKVQELPLPLFTSWNIDAILSLVGNVGSMTKDEITKRLDEVNEGAGQALLLLA